VSRILALADPDLVNFSDGQPCEFGESGLDALKNRLANLFERFTAKLSAIVIEIRLQGDIAYDLRMHELTLTPDGGRPIRPEIVMWIFEERQEGNWSCGFIWITDVADSEARVSPSAEV